MASVFLRFTPPDRENLISLRIYEEATADGPWDTIIETVDLVAEGVSYPDYLDQYTTTFATSKLNWFAIQWVDDKGATTEISNPVQGGTESLVGEIISLVGERDNNLDSQVVRQETEFAIETYFGKDPYTVLTEGTSYRQRIGLARLVQARSMLAGLATSTGGGGGWTAGLVSMKNDTTGDEKLVRWLLTDAGNLLGLNYARVAQMATMVIAGGMSSYDNGILPAVLVEVE